MSTSQAIEALKSALPGAVFAFPGSTEYIAIMKQYQSGTASELSPACFVQPSNADEFSIFVKAIKPFALSGAAPFAIVGLGQQPAARCSNIKAPGITLSLQRLKGIAIKDGVVEVAAGESWGPVYDMLAERGLGFSGGRSYRSGIGGLALAGGLSFVSSREGFISDNVLNYEVVLSSGEIVNANAKENTDLWVALRGGGNNLGVVTRFDFRTFEQGNVWGGTLYYFGDSFPGQLDALANELNKPDASSETHIMVSMGYAAMFGPQIMCLNQVYDTKGTEKSPVLQPFFDIQPQIDQLNTLRIHNLADAAREQAGDRPSPGRSNYMNTTVKADADTLKAAAKIFQKAIEPLKSIENVLLSFTLQPYPATLLRKSATQGGNVLGLDPELGSLVSILFLTFWEHKEDDEKVMSTLREALAAIDREAEARKTLVPFKYLNYADTTQDPIGSYGVENVKKLQDVSGIYDPDGLFQKGVPGGWKLFA
ncbi:FAD-binding domain-containing protein [Xylariomycetidae sp. FL2044]|nr:FAD-binding domain-containing protein [Xylariomycetidae sp. FL2044]